MSHEISSVLLLFFTNLPINHPARDWKIQMRINIWKHQAVVRQQTIAGTKLRRARPGMRPPDTVPPHPGPETPKRTVWVFFFFNGLIFCPFLNVSGGNYSKNPHKESLKPIMLQTQTV